MSHNRRSFLKISGGISLLPALVNMEASAAPTATTSASTKGSTMGGRGSPTAKRAFAPLAYSNVDEISLAKGFEWYPLLKTGDVINAQGHKAGDCCDFLHFFAGNGPDQAFLWVNHEYIIFPLAHGKAIVGTDKTKEQIDLERSLVGGSYIELRRSGTNQKRWKVVADSTLAFRLDGTTEIPLVGPAGGRSVVGTMGNCGGGFTPWGSILTGEENVDAYYASGDAYSYGWARFYPSAKVDHGWVVEVDVKNKSARKLTALGRFAHEGATTVTAKNKKVVVYMGDDAKGQCLYKFVSKGTHTGDAEKDKDLLVEGSLYVANLKTGEWVLLSPENPALAKDEQGRFKTQADICMYTRDAAALAGGTKLNRPEDVKVHPKTGEVYFTLTNNSDVGDMHGSIALLREEQDDHSGTRFSLETHVVGGPKAGFSCPDNLTFGPGQSLWVATDISADNMGKGPHTAFARNSFLRLETDAPGNIYARHFLQGPWEAEITGPSFSPDGRYLFLSIQHPGENSFEKGKGLTSHWPSGGASSPLSTVIVVEEKGGRFV